MYFLIYISLKSFLQLKTTSTASFTGSRVLGWGNDGVLLGVPR